MSDNLNTAAHRLDIPVGTKVITSPHVQRRWASRIMVVVAQPKSVRGTYVLRCPSTEERVRISSDAISIYDGEQEAGRDLRARLDAPAPLHAGVVARVTGVRGIPDGTLVVSLGPARNEHQTKVARLGGDSGRYWTGVPTESLTVVTATVSD
ncbi:hypothetical protein [Pseudactinotalea terrae]|uniref:hypothetical protein n=1 Tax=Pseudactinotalea terrae TaxID=1743262 RepID=UPI0012E1EC06|nr:hypothetical protein [Pseudactinotalea terrae]